MLNKLVEKLFGEMLCKRNKHKFEGPATRYSMYHFKRDCTRPGCKAFKVY